MCAIPDKATTEEFRNRNGPQRAYKVIHKKTARPLFFPWGTAYRPGHNVDRKATNTYLGYKRGTTRGFHCYLDRNTALSHQTGAWDRKNLAVVCVSFGPCDVIVAESSRWSNGQRKKSQQVVVRALHISKRAWKQAGLPIRKGAAS